MAGVPPAVHKKKEEFRFLWRKVLVDILRNVQGFTSNMSMICIQCSNEIEQLDLVLFIYSYSKSIGTKCFHISQFRKSLSLIAFTTSIYSVENEHSRT